MRLLYWLAALALPPDFWHWLWRQDIRLGRFAGYVMGLALGKRWTDIRMDGRR